MPAAGAIYLGHIWFISVFSINIFLELFAKNRSDYCKLDSHGDLLCGSRDGAWLAISDIFNAVPWIMTGILIWIMIYFGGRWFFVKGLGARFTPARGKQLVVAGLLLSTATCVATWPVYDNGFWDAKGLLTIDNYEELEAMRSQPGDIHVHESTIFLNETACEYIDAEDLLVPASMLDAVEHLPTRADAYHRLRQQQPAPGPRHANEHGGRRHLLQRHHRVPSHGNDDRHG